MPSDDIRWCYQILDAEPEASLSEIKRSYRDLMNVWHPDRFTHDPRLREKCERKVKELNEAYQRLETFARRGELLAQQKEADSQTGRPSEQELDPSEYLKPIQYRGRWGYCDPLGRLHIAAQFDAAKPFSEGLAAVETSGGWAYVDGSGQIAIEPRFAEAGEFSEGLAAVLLAGKYGYIDKCGEVVVRPRFEAAQRFSEGFAGVRWNGRFGYIRRDGGWLVQPQFSEVHPFANGRGYARLGEIWAHVTRSGETQYL